MIGTRHRKVPAALAALAVATLAWQQASTRTVWAQASTAPRADAAPGRVLAPVTRADRGSTYHALDGRAKRVVTRFAGATAVAERAADGGVTSRLIGPRGEALARVRVHRVDATRDMLELAREGTGLRQVARPAALRPTLEWANRQAHSVWNEAAVLTEAAEWQDDLLRPHRARRLGPDDEPLQIDTAWDGGMSASVIRKVGVYDAGGRGVRSVVYVSALYKAGIEIGFSQWWPEQQLFGWSIPGVTEGFVDAARLGPAGGWPFAPDMAWLNTQNLAFHEFHAAVAARRSISERDTGWLKRVSAWLAPTLLANEPGCDYLHWLDGSIFRPCCDDHDRCYAKSDPACGAYSWWWWWLNWHCTQCNTWAAWCFATGGGSRVLHRFP